MADIAVTMLQPLAIAADALRGARGSGNAQFRGKNPGAAKQQGDGSQCDRQWLHASHRTLYRSLKPSHSQITGTSHEIKAGVMPLG
ncbi:hypothetical protein ABTH31_20750, partial [Acinetobacter baumannii]